MAYANEDDKAFGLAGMAVSLATLDATDRIAEIWLDAEGPMVSFSHEYYFSGSPSISPKATWNNLLRNFHLTTSMLVGNVMARALVRLGEREVPSEIMDSIRTEVVREAEESCSLEEDEATALLRNVIAKNNRIFFNPRVHPLVKELASIISQRRRLSGRELDDVLGMLQL